MRKSSWITVTLLALLFAVVEVPTASGQVYEITFSCRTTAPACVFAPPSSPDVTLTAPNLTGFTLTWRGQTVPLSTFPPVSSPPSSDVYGWVISVNERGDKSGEFVTAYICNYSVNSCDNTGNYTDPYGDALGTSFSDGGPVTFTEVSATPEPGTAILIVVGFGMMMRKHYVQWSHRN